MSSICGASRGRYGLPEKIDPEINWVDEDDNPIKTPLKLPCDHPDHWKWGKGTRNGQKLYYPTYEMYSQRWELTEKELQEAIDSYDMFSLEVEPRYVCENCKNQIMKVLQNETEKETEMNLKKGCPYCIYLECTDKEPLEIRNFKCLRLPYRKIANAGACFIDTDSNSIIHDCQYFSNELEETQ